MRTGFLIDNNKKGWYNQYMWLEDQVDSTVTKTVDEKWLKIPDAEVGKTTEVRMRILDEQPIGVWRHYFGGRPYNCEGLDRCPVCKVRFEAKKNHPDTYKEDYRMDYRYYFNVFVDGAVKIYSFPSGVGRKLKMFEGKYGDLRDYDISIQKRKTGMDPKNVEYTPIFEEKSALTIEQSEAVKYDLTDYIKPALHEDLISISRGETPVPVSQDNGLTPEPVKAGKATKADMIMLKALMAEKNFELGDFGLVEASPPSKEVIAKLIDELKKKE